MIARSLKPMICASQPTSRLYRTCAPTQSAMARRSISLASETPSSTRSCSAGRTRSFLQIAGLVDKPQPQTSFEEAVEIVVGFDTSVSRRYGHVAGDVDPFCDGGVDLALLRRVER